MKSAAKLKHPVKSLERVRNRAKQSTLSSIGKRWTAAVI